MKRLHYKTAVGGKGAGGKWLIKDTPRRCGFVQQVRAGPAWVQRDLDCSGPGKSVVQIALGRAFCFSPFPPSHRAMDVRLPATNLIISSAVLGTLRVPSRGRNKNYSSCFPVWRILHRSCLCWQIQPSIISPANGPSNPPLAGGCLLRWQACFFRGSHKHTEPPLASWQYPVPTSWTPGGAHRPRLSDNDKLPLTQEASIGGVPDSPAATRGVTVHEAPFTPFRSL